MKKDDESKLRWLSYLAIALLIIGVFLLITNPTGTSIQMDVVELGSQLYSWRE